MVGLGAAGVAAAAGGWVATARADRRAIERDPDNDLLNRELDGRALTLRSFDGTELHVEEFGPADAPPLVLVHGWTASIGFWTRQIQSLSDQFRVIAYDARGHGASGAGAGGDYTIEALARDLDTVLAECAGGEPAILAGHSMGGMTVVAWAGLHADSVSERLAGAALLNTGMGDLLRESRILHLPRSLDRQRMAFGYGVLTNDRPLPSRATPISHRVTRYVALSRAAAPAAVHYSDVLTSQAIPAVRSACGRTLARIDLYDSLESLVVPTVVLAGGHDRLTPPVHAERMAERLPNLASHVVIPHSGHMSPLTDADVVERELRALAPARVAQTSAR